MNNIKYEIKIDENEIPYISFPEEYNNTTENNFFAIQLTFFVFKNMLENNNGTLDEDSMDNLNTCVNVIEEIGYELAMILKDQMEFSGDLHLMLNQKYHIQVKTLKERNDLNLNNIVYNDKIYSREEGLKVFVTDKMKIYELKDGIDNKHWRIIK